MDNVPFTQGEGWDNYTNNKDNCVYFVDNSAEPTICCRGELYKKPFVGSILRIQGEATKKPEQETVRNFYQEITQMGYSLILVSSLSPYEIEYEIGIREAGFVRPLYQPTCPLTIFVPTIDRPAPHRSWKRNVKKAEKAGCTFRFIPQPTQEDCNIFVQLFGEMAVKKHLSYTLNNQSVYKMLKDPGYKLFFIYSAANSILSGRVIYTDNKKGWDIFAANSNESRENGASYFICEKILDYLAEQNIETFDFGRIGPGLTSSNLVYLFKQASGGYPIQYNGEWIFAKNKSSELMMLLYRYVLKNGNRY